MILLLLCTMDAQGSKTVLLSQGHIGAPLYRYTS